ncbi:MAG: hypothetical protein IT440_04585 [Phycisphaeraceae bacterium]|nr:hypothetical protein [Phycisphaeraceae bacterium]
MMTQTKVMYVLMMALSITTVAKSEEAPAATHSTPAATVNNAALLYWQAFALLPGREEMNRVAALLDQPVGDESRQLAGVGKQSLTLLHKAAMIPACDWGLLVEDGPAVLLPHVSKSRELARLALLEAKVHEANGQHGQAADAWVDVLALGRHAAQDQMLLEVIVSQWCERQALPMLESRVDALSSAEARMILNRLEQLPSAPRVAEAIRRDGRIMTDWAMNQVRTAGPGALKPLMDERNAEQLKTWTTEQVLAMLQDVRKQSDELARLAGKDNAEGVQAMRSFEQQLNQTTNLFVKLMLPPTVGAVVARNAENRAKLAGIEQSLRVRAQASAK